MNESTLAPVSLRGGAYHEAGHAVLGHLFGMTLAGVTITPLDELRAAATRSSAPHPLILQQKGVLYEGTVEQDQWICHQIMRLQAGEVAQEEFCPESLERHHAAADRVQIQRWIARWNCYARPAERDAKIESLYLDTRHLLTAHLCAAAVDAVAEALLERMELTGLAAHTIISKAMKDLRDSATASGEQPPTLNCPHCEAYADWTDDPVSVRLFP